MAGSYQVLVLSENLMAVGNAASRYIVLQGEASQTGFNTRLVEDEIELVSLYGLDPTLALDLSIALELPESTEYRRLPELAAAVAAHYKSLPTPSDNTYTPILLADVDFLRGSAGMEFAFLLARAGVKRLGLVAVATPPPANQFNAYPTFYAAHCQPELRVGR